MSRRAVLSAHTSDGFRVMEKEIVSEKKNKPVYDEQTLANLLEAAYVLQEHSRLLRQQGELRVEAHEPPADPHLPDLEPDLETADLEKPIASLAPPTPEAVAKVVAAEPSKEDYTPTLAQIVETQHQIQKRHLNLNAAIS